MTSWSAVVAMVGVCLVSCGDDKSGPNSAANPFAMTPSGAGSSTPAPSPAPAPAAASPSDPGFGEVAFKTYEADGKRVVFTTPTSARISWRNMVGKPVDGTYTQTGKEILIQWDPKADNIGALTEKFRQMGPCSMASYQRIDKEGKVHEGSPKIYQQTKPRCDTVRISQ